MIETCPNECRVLPGKKLWQPLLIGTFLSLPVPAIAQACPVPAVPKGSSPAEVPLCLVAQQVVKTLNAFNLEANSRALPKLSRVSFDFNTTVSKSAGASFNILIFKFGASREGDTGNEVTFTYAVPPPAAAQARTAPQAHDFSQALLATLDAAAAQVKQTESIGPAQFSNLTVTLTYGAVWDVSGGGSGTLGLVTLDGSVDRKRADVQTLTLIFGS